MVKVRKKVNSVKNHSEVNKSVVVEKNLGRAKETVKEEEYVADAKGNNNPPRNTPTNMLKEGKAVVGLSKGCTLNLGNYQSARIDVSITRICNDNEKSIMDNLADISVLLDEQLEYEEENLNEE